MAVQPVTKTMILGDTGLGDTGNYIAGWRYQWATMANGDTGAVASNVPGFPDRSIQVFGTFGTGGSVAAEGTNEVTPTNWSALTDPQGNTIAITAANIKAITEAVINFRPHVTGGDGTTALTVIVYFRNTQQRP